MKNLLHTRSRLKKKSFIKRHLPYWKLYLSLMIIGFILGYIMLLGTIEFGKKLFSLRVYAPTTKVMAQEFVPTPTPEIEGVQPTQEEIEKYIKTIFGKEARIAIAISHNECNPANAKYPRCILHSDVEYSVGIFQVNLYNSKQWIHAGRIPGATMEEKAEWLKNPFNNTLYAYWVYQKSGWNPWTAYTSGNYLNDL